MIDFVLFLFVAASIIVTIYDLKTQGILLNVSTFPNIFYTSIIVLPLLEESVFRNILKYILGELQYADHINATLFGLAHVTNYLYDNNISVILFQVIYATYVGYYLLQFDILLHSFLIHMILNIITLGCSYWIYFMFFQRKESLKVDYVDFHPGDVYVNNIYVAERTKDDIYTHKSSSLPKASFVSKDKINEDMLERIDKLRTIERRRISCGKRLEI